MSKIYTASMLRRPASPRSDKLKAVTGGSSSSSHSSSSSSSLVPAAADSVFWKYFGLDEEGGLYVKMTEAGDPRNFWTYGNLAAGGMKTDTEGSGGVSYLKELEDIYHSASGILRANGDPISNGDILAYDSANARWYAKAENQGGGSGTLTRVAAAGANGISVSGSPLTSDSGQLVIGIGSGYKLPTTSEWNGKQNTISDLSTIRSNAAAGAAKVSNVQSDWNATTGLAAILNRPTIPTSLADLEGDATHRLVTDDQITAWTNKQEPLTAGTDYYTPQTIARLFQPKMTEGSDYLTKAHIQSLVTDAIAGKADASDIPTVPTNVSAFTNDAGYLTQHQDLSNYLTKTEAGRIYQSKLGLNSVLDIRAIELRDQSEALVVPAWDAILSGSGENLSEALSDPNWISTDSTHLWLTQNYIDTWNAKQNAMTAGTDYLTPAQIAAAYLPLTGGTLSRTDQDVLILQNTNANYVRLRMLDSTGDKTLTSLEWESYWGGSFSVNNANGTLAGKLGIFPNGKPYYGYLVQDGVNIDTYELLHEGNWRDLAHLDLKSFAPLGGSENLNNAFHPAEGEYRGFFRYYAYVGRDASAGTAGVNGFPTGSNANALLSIGTYDDGTNLGVYQIGLSANGNIYFRENGSTLTPFTDGNWSRLLWEDHNGDAAVTRDLSVSRQLNVAGDVVLPQSGGFWFDTAKNYVSSAYFVRGNPSDGDYSFYLHTGTDGNGNPAAMFIECGVLYVYGGDVRLQKGNAVGLDAGKDAYIQRGGSSTDYALYICAGHGSDGMSKVYTHVFTAALCPNATADQSNLGASNYVWNNLYAKRWYPDPTNAPTAYIEWDATNQAFKINGPVYSTGQVAAGGIFSNS